MSIIVKKAQHILCALVMWLLLVPLACANAQLKAAKDSIIYDYKTITQKKGESFSSFLNNNIPSSDERKLITAIPILHTAKSNRQFHLSYAIKKDKRTLQEVKVIRGNRVINFVLTDKDGKKQFVKKSTKVPLVLQSYLTSDSDKVKTSDDKQEKLYSYGFLQKKGQSLKAALKPANLNGLQQQIIETGDFIKSAKSDREFTLYFAKQGAKKLLKGLRVKRNQSIVEYQVQKSGDKFTLVNLATIKVTKRDAIRVQFDKASYTSNTQTIKPAKKTTTAEKKPITLASTENSDFGLQLSQKKGQTVENALSAAQLSKKQLSIVLSGDYTKAAKSERQILLLFEKSGSRKLLKGMRISRNGVQVDYVVKKIKGKFLLVNLKTLAAEQQKRLSKLLSSVKVTKLKPHKKIVLASARTSRYTAKQFNQYKGQSLAKACGIAKLSKLQQQIINSGDFVKSAKSTRQFTLYYEASGKKSLLRGLRVTRNKSSIDYAVKKTGKKFTLVNLKTLPKSEANTLKNQFQSAAVQRLKAPKTGKPAISSKQSPSLLSRQSQGRYEVMSVTQKKGQTLYSAIKRMGLSTSQRRLVINMPASQSAKSNRKIHLLFEKNGKLNYLRAMRIVRGNRSAEYVLAKNKGKLIWADEKGRVTTSGGFTRYPVRFSRVSSGFNLRRRHPITRRIRPHKGIDLKAAHGTPVYAPASGVVKYSGRQRGYGIILEIDHQNGYRTKYAHLSRIMRSARKGRYIKKGQLIAKVGNTGISSGAHLHYEILVNGRARNPRTVRLPGGGGKKTLPAAKSAARKYLPTLRKLSR